MAKGTDDGSQKIGIAVRFDRKTFGKLNELADRHDRSFGSMVRILVNEALISRQRSPQDSSND